MSAVARRRLPTTSGFASLRNPMCVSLICTKVSAFAGALAPVLSPVAPSARGTPPAMVQTTAAPLQAARQLSASRRAGLTGLPSGLCVFMFELLVAQAELPAAFYTDRGFGFIPGLLPRACQPRPWLLAHSTGLRNNGAWWEVLGSMHGSLGHAGAERKT